VKPVQRFSIHSTTKEGTDWISHSLAGLNPGGTPGHGFSRVSQHTVPAPPERGANEEAEGRGVGNARARRMNIHAGGGLPPRSLTASRAPFLSEHRTPRQAPRTPADFQVCTFSPPANRTCSSVQENQNPLVPARRSPDPLDPSLEQLVQRFRIIELFWYSPPFPDGVGAGAGCSSKISPCCEPWRLSPLGGCGVRCRNAGLPGEEV